MPQPTSLMRAARPPAAARPTPSPRARGEGWGEGQPEASRVAAFDWTEIEAALDQRGFAVLSRLVDERQWVQLAALYEDETAFRSRVVMARYNFGRGEYKYLRYPLPDTIERLRRTLYPHLAPVANRWHERMGFPTRFPATLAAYLDRCHAAGQTRPTPLILKYEPGDYNCLHQDLYGELVFPLQLTVLLSRPDEDFTGGEFLLVEQRPRMQSKGEVVPLSQGDAVIFAVSQRPVKGVRGDYRVTMRHGVSRVRSGRRFTLGIIFHDAA